MIKFRFQDLKIWQLVIEIADKLFDIADELEKKKLYRFAEQLRASGMSMMISTNFADKLPILENPLNKHIRNARRPKRYAPCALRHAASPNIFI